MSNSAPSPPLARWLYTHNPFYAISTVLMLFAVRSAYGEIEIGTINCWLLSGVLIGYAGLLAAIAVLIIRWGAIWEDARSLLVLLLLLFLALSVSADDLFAKMESASGGMLLLGCAYLCCALLTEAVLHFSRIRLRFGYRLPLHAMLNLFFVASWWCSPELHERSNEALEWNLLLFPFAGAAIILTLLPAVRRGPDYTKQNGTPWPWPWFPWTAFGVLIAAMGLRTFTLCMTYGPFGPIWIPTSGGKLLISFDTMWGPYLLIPLAFAVLVLMLESSLVSRNRSLARTLTTTAPLLLLLALPYSNGPVFRDFFDRLIATCGSPLWWTTWLLLGFYARAALGGVAYAERGILASIGLLSIVGPSTTGFETLVDPQVVPLLVAAAGLLWIGLRRQSALECLAAGCIVLTAWWHVVPETSLAPYRAMTTYHGFWLLVIVCGLWFRDRLAVVLQVVGAALMPMTAVAVLASERAASVPMEWRMTYVVALAIASLLLARLYRNRIFLTAFLSLAFLASYGVAVLGYRAGVRSLGERALTAFSLSAGMLLIAVLISAHKARWLPTDFLTRWSGWGMREKRMRAGPTAE